MDSHGSIWTSYPPEAGSTSGHGSDREANNRWHGCLLPSHRKGTKKKPPPKARAAVADWLERTSGRQAASSKRQTLRE